MLKDRKVVGHDLCSDTWRLDLQSNKWTRIEALGSPPNRRGEQLGLFGDARRFDHFVEHGGDRTRFFIMGHSAGAQLAALICTDDR